MTTRPSPSGSDIAADVRGAIGRRNSSYRAVARLLNVDTQAFWRRLQGRPEFTMPELVAIAGALDMSLHELVPSAFPVEAAS